MKNKIKLHGFNNLTKSLSFNIYDISYTRSIKQQQEYLEYIDEEYNATRLTGILKEVASIIGANVLNIAHQDYDPQGASVTMLIAEEPVLSEEHVEENTQEEPGPLPDAIVGHLDKSHITVHTYPESHPQDGISTFRADIDVATCGLISPLRALNFLIHSFDSDIVIADYRVRGFTRDVDGNKHYIDHLINSIQNFMSEDTRRRYQMMDVNIYQENIFHTKMILKDFSLDDYLYGITEADFEVDEAEEVRAKLNHEMQEIFSGRNIT